jgi:signal transduction histidine kinase
MKRLRPAMVNLNDVVGEVTDLLRRTLGSNIEVVEQLDPDIPSVMVDTGELQQALVNLAINARDAMPDGGTLTIRTEMAVLDLEDANQHADLTTGSYVMLSVSDTGVGMPPDIVGRIFEPFFTTKSGSQRSGLGLSMVYGFLKQSGGQISVQSEEGSGTIFKLFFPRASDPDEAGPGAPLDKAG